MGRIPDVVSRFVQEFRGERSLAYAGAVCFHHAENVLHHMGSDAGTDAGAAGGRMGRGNEWVGAVIAVQHGSLGAVEEDVLAFPYQGLHGVVRIGHIGAELFSVTEIIVQHGFIVEAFHAIELFQKHILLGHIVFQFFRKCFLVHEVAHTDADAVDLICIAGSDAVLCGADFMASLPCFFCFIETDMVREYHLGTGGNLEMLCIDSLVFEPFHFFQKALGVHYDAGADDADGAGIHNAAGHEAERISLAAGNYGMACVITALGADDYVCLCGEIINDLAFTFIAPLGTDYHCCCHVSFFLPVRNSHMLLLGKCSIRFIHAQFTVLLYHKREGLSVNG